MDNSKRVALACLALAIGLKLKEKKVEKRIWVKPWMLKYGVRGPYETVYREWRESDPEMYRTMLRMYPEDFADLLRGVDPFIAKQDTQFRNAISSEKRLAITLRYLVTGDSFVSLSGTFCVSTRSIRRIIVETCKAITLVLRPYIKTPSTKDEWMAIADQFWERWDWPCCIGALDGKHILIQPPKDSGSHYFNYKGQHSVVLMALVGPDLKFIYADVGMNGRVSDGGVWSRNQFRQKLESGQLDLPDPHPFNFHIVGDAAFPLSTTLLRPYSGVAVKQNRPRKWFNYRLSRARRTSENAFGILVHRFEIFRAPMRTSPENVVSSVLATLALHNWLMSSTGPGPRYRDDCPPSPAPGGILKLAQQIGNRSSNQAQELRESVCSFISLEGFREWMDEQI